MPKDRKKPKEQKKGSPAWMTTFSDMMTLLLVFFVLLYSFSEMDLDKFQGFISALQSKLGVLDGGQTITDQSQVSRGSQGEKFNPSNANFAKVMGEVSEYVHQQNLQNEVEMVINERGLVVRMSGQVLYDLGKAEIKPDGKKILDRIASSLAEIPNQIIVEGHTDNIPISTVNFPSNWELSTTRATNVIKYLIEVHNFEPARLAAAGYSKYRPIKTNDNPQNRAENRRVEVVILKQG